MIRALSLFLLTVWAIAVPAWGLEHVSIQLKWLHQFQFAGYYAAIEQGYYAEEGLDVTLKERRIDVNNIEQVLRGESEYGIGDSVLLLYQARRRPVVIVAPIFQHSPNVLITLRSSGIDSPYKLVGKRIAFYPNDADGLPILAMLHETGVLKRGFQRVDRPFDIDALEKGEVDAHHGYITNEPYMLLQRGIRTNIINPLNFGVDLYGDILFCTQKELKLHPKRVAAMKRATIRGWEYALAHKEEMIRLIRAKYAPDKTPEQLRYEADGIESVISPATIPIGTLDYGRLEYLQALLRRHGLIDSTVPLSDYIYRDAQTRQSLDLTSEEIAWLKHHPHIRLGNATARKPIEFIDAEGRYEGIAADYLRLLSRKLGITFVPRQSGDWDTLLPAIRERSVDLLPAAVRTPELESRMIFTAPYLRFPMAVVTRGDISYINGIHDLQGKTVAVNKGGFAATSLGRFYPQIRRLKVGTTAEGLEAVQTGKAYAFVGNTASVTRTIQDDGFSSLKISGELPHPYEMAIAVRNDWPLFASIMTKALASLSDEERDAIYRRHIALEYTQTLSWSQLMTFIAPLGIIVVILLYYTRRQHHFNRALTMAFNSLAQTQKELEKANEKLQTLSATDQLTSLANRRQLDETLKQSIEHAKRYRRPFSIILIDLDHFKQVNDTYGHAAGDLVLKHSASVFRDHTRLADTIGRWGGEEFLILCPETTLSDAIVLAEKLRRLLAAETMPHGEHQTASFGVCAFDSDDLTPEHLVRRADDALYLAKEEGRNRVYPCESL